MIGFTVVGKPAATVITSSPGHSRRSSSFGDVNAAAASRFADDPEFTSVAFRTPKYRAEINEMGEVPVLVHGQRKLSQSGVCLTYLADRTGRFQPQGEDERLECLRWIIFDNQKVNGFLGPYRYLRNFAPARDPGAEAFLKGRVTNSLGIVDKRLAGAPYLLGARPTIADLSLAGYMYYPAEEFGFDIARDFPAIGAWMERIRALPGWGHPYELMPGYPLVK